MEFPRDPRDPSPRSMRPRLAMMAALLDEWSLPFGGMFRGRRPGQGLSFPKWLLSDDLPDDRPDRPVLRRCRSTWATWPSGSQEEEEDADEPWFQRHPDESTSLEALLTPRRPRDQEELRAARRRYFERRRHQPTEEHDVQGVQGHGQQAERRQRPASWHSPQGPQGPQRVSFAREVPIGRDLPRDVPTSKRDAAVEAVSAPRRDSATMTEPPEEESLPRTRNIRIELSDSHKELRASIAGTASAIPRATASTIPTATVMPSVATIPIRVAGSSAKRDANQRQDVECDGSLVPLSLLHEEQRRCRQLQEENLRLKAVITTIQETNQRWQGFNATRQAYIQRLLNTIEEQQTQLNACLDALKTSSPRPHSEPSTSASATASSPNLKASDLASDAEVRLRRLQREVSDLHRRLQEAKKEHRDTVSMLQSQIDSQREEEAERAERAERAARTASETRQRAESILKELAKQMNVNTMESEEGVSTASPVRPCYYDVVMDGPGEKVGDGLLPEMERRRSQYSFDGQALLQQRRDGSPALSDALTPTPSTPLRQQDEAWPAWPCYPVELTGSACSLGSLGSVAGPAPHVDVPSSSRATTPDLDVSMCSDATLDCSPPSPVQGRAQGPGVAGRLEHGLRLF